MSDALPDLQLFADRVLYVVRQIPAGSVSTYGQVALYAGANGAARAVGNVLRGRGENVPWQRVINATGAISIRGDLVRPLIQRELLEEEGIIFKANHTCDLRQYGWQPDLLYWSD